MPPVPPYAVDLSERDPQISQMTQICNEKRQDASRMTASFEAQIDC
jgi:hypothetical protein